MERVSEFFFRKKKKNWFPQKKWSEEATIFFFKKTNVSLPQKWGKAKGGKKFVQRKKRNIDVILGGEKYCCLQTKWSDEINKKIGAPKKMDRAIKW